MLKKNLIGKTKSLLPAVLIAGLGVLASHNTANAALLNFVDKNPVDGSTDLVSYNYTVQLSANETVDLLDSFVLDDVFGVGVTGGVNTQWTAQNPENQAKFIYISENSTNGPAEFVDFSILAPSTAVDGTRSYSFAEKSLPGYNNGSLSGNGSVVAPIEPTSVPESSSVLGILLVGGLASANQLRKQLVKS